jgi:hypothetical protein
MLLPKSYWCARHRWERERLGVAIFGNLIVSFMQSQSFERHAQLAQWLHRLVEILRTTGGATWEALLETLDEKTAIIDLDGVVLRVRAFGGEQLQVESAYPMVQTSVNFLSNSETLRDAIAGKLTFKLTH